MRPEYYEAIRYRRWNELEHYARRRPEQPLCDTVYALAESIGEKQDRKALKRILHLLAMAGIQPQTFDEPAPEETSPRKSSLGYACMASHAPQGQFGILVALPNGKVAEGYAIVAQERFCYCQEDPMRVPLRHMGVYRRNYLSKFIAPLVCEVDLDYAVWRVARALDRRQPVLHGGREPRIPSFWKRVFENAAEVDHPSFRIIPKPIGAARARAICETTPAISAFRIAIGAEPRALDAVHALRWAEDMSAQDLAEAIREVLDTYEEELWDHNAILEHHYRLRDIAYMLDLKRDPLAAEVVSLAEDLDKKGSQSEYAKWLMDISARDVESIVGRDELEEVGSFAWAA